jgi:hypothetical protein
MTRLPLAAVAAIAMAVFGWGFEQAAPGAGCRQVAGNLMAKFNCGFDKDVAGYKDIFDNKVVHVPATGGDPRSAAMRVTSGAQSSIAVEGACVPVQGSTNYQFSARLRLASGTPYICALNWWQYSDLKCEAGAEPLAGEARPPSNDWATIQGTGRAQASAKAVRLRADCSGSGVISIIWDDFSFAPQR